MSLSKENISALTGDEIRLELENIFINKCISLDNIDLVLNKLIEVKEVVIKESNTTNKQGVVLKGKDTTNKNVEIVQAEIVESVNTTYDTTIMFDVQQMYRENVKTSMRFNLISKAFGIKGKDRFEIEEEEFKKIQDHGERIDKQIDEIYEEYLYINKQNDELKALGSDIRLVQDIYIDCYDKYTNSEEIKDRLYLSHQCGFASCDSGNELSIPQQWAKIKQGQDQLFYLKEVQGRL